MKFGKIRKLLHRNSNDFTEPEEPNADHSITLQPLSHTHRLPFFLASHTNSNSNSKDSEDLDEDGQSEWKLLHRISSSLQTGGHVTTALPSRIEFVLQILDNAAAADFGVADTELWQRVEDALSVTHMTDRYTELHRIGKG